MAVSERAQIENYLKEYAVQECLDEVVNELVEQRPANPYSHISKFMETKTLGEILDLKLRCILTSRGLVGVEATVFTNITQFKASCPVNDYNTKLGGDSLIDFTMVLAKAKDAIRGLNPTSLKEIDEAIAGCQHMTPPVALAISMASCRAGARHSNKELYRYLADIAELQPRVPVPVISVVGRAAGGGINISQGITVIPTTPSFFEGAMESCISASNVVLAKLNELKTSSTVTVPDLGIPIVGNDMQLEELIEIVSNALSEEGVDGTPKIGIDYRSVDLTTPIPHNDEIPMEDNSNSNSAITYQLEGLEDNPLSGGDVTDILIPMWRKTSIITIEDPLNNKDSIALEEFNEKFEECITDIRNTMSADCSYNLKGIGSDGKCFLQLISDKNVNSMNDINMIKYPYNTIKINLFNGGGSIYEVLNICKNIKNSTMCLVTGVSKGIPETSDDFLADFAVAVGCSQYYGGGIGNSEYSCKYTRLVDIAATDETLKYVGKKFR